ncbi:hypothetical protein [Streptomyces sp. NPDC005408]|uniref:hypothetical protein n=1 Tax=Streptomyces sp. NPDC005408 TaxID=3155341 RepID=UPI0033A9D84A
MADLGDLLLDVEPGAKRAATHTQWVSENRKPYDNRLREARDLIMHLADSYDKAQSALLHYASALETARSHHSDGKAAEQTWPASYPRARGLDTGKAETDPPSSSTSASPRSGA